MLADADDFLRRFARVRLVNETLAAFSLPSCISLRLRSALLARAWRSGSVGDTKDYLLERIC
jgi:hypothetical protein